jgi:hypothetical protein
MRAGMERPISSRSIYQDRGAVEPSMKAAEGRVSMRGNLPAIGLVRVRPRWDRLTELVTSSHRFRS